MLTIDLDHNLIIEQILLENGELPCIPDNRISGNVKVKTGGKIRNVWVTDIKNCKDYKCFHPHDCPIQGAKGVRNSQERWMCLTNFHQGCPDEPQKKK